VRRLTGTLAYVAWMTWQVVSLSVRLGRDVFTPGLDVTPRIVRFPVGGATDLEVTLFASSITITPGTLVLGIAPPVDDAPRSLYVQAMYGADEGEVLRGLADMESRLLWMTRGVSRGTEVSEQ
jgi:multicomponent Na+:H+ antiporter subunit E